MTDFLRKSWAWSIRPTIAPNRRIWTLMSKNKGTAFTAAHIPGTRHAPRAGKRKKEEENPERIFTQKGKNNLFRKATLSLLTHEV